MRQDRVTVVEPNGVQRTRPLTPRGMMIGRGGGCDLIVAYSSVSRNHARVTFDGKAYYVTDLGSANGTYLGDTRLMPNESTPWTFGQPLHIGQVTIHLQQLEPEVASATVADAEATRMWTAEEMETVSKATKKRNWVAIALWIAIPVVLVVIALLVVLFLLVLNGA